MRVELIRGDDHLALGHGDHIVDAAGVERAVGELLQVGVVRVGCLR